MQSIRFVRFLFFTYHELKHMMRARCPWYKTDMAPTLTGLPPHLVIITEMKNMETVMESIPSNLLETVHEELDRSMIGY